MAQTSIMTKERVKGIMNKRAMLSTDNLNKKVVFTVQGNGNVQDVKNVDGELVLSTIAGQEGVVLQKKIFNLKANSAIAMSNPRTRQYMLNGLKAESTGKPVKGIIKDKEDNYDATAWYNAYLNACQVSFGILLPSRVADRLSDGLDIAAKVIRIDTDNGSLLTIDPSTITVQEPEVIGTTSFNLDDFLTETEEKPTTGAKTSGTKKAGAK